MNIYHDFATEQAEACSWEENLIPFSLILLHSLKTQVKNVSIAHRKMYLDRGSGVRIDTKWQLSNKVSQHFRDSKTTESIGCLCGLPACEGNN